MEGHNQNTLKARSGYLDNVVLVLIFLAPSLSKSIIVPGIAFSDIFLLIAVLLCLTRIPLRDFSLVPRWFLYGLLTYSWIILSGFFASTYSQLFSLDEFLKSFMKYNLYFFSAFIIFVYLRKFHNVFIYGILFKIVLFQCFLGFYIWFAQTIKTYSGVQIPYDFFWLGQGGPLIIGPDLNRWSIGTFELIKFRGIFGEPSLYSGFQVLSLTLIFFKAKDIFLKHISYVFLVILSLLLTSSLTSIALLLVLFFSIMFTEKKLKFGFLKSRSISIGLAIVISASLFSPVSPVDVFQRFIVQRTAEVVSGEDRSSVMRIYGSFDTAKYIADRSPLYGSAIGNIDTFFTKSGGQLTYFTGINESIKVSTTIHNIPLYFLGSLGYVGFVMYLFSLIFVVRGTGFLGSLPYFFSLASTGSVLEVPYWIYYLLFCRRQEVNET